MPKFARDRFCYFATLTSESPFVIRKQIFYFEFLYRHKPVSMTSEE